jgi:SPP1 gp7 family putative phage head morphogenesis protein
LTYTDEEFELVEQEELALTEEALLAMLATLTSTQVELEKELRSFYQKYGKDDVVTYAEARKWVSEKDHRKRWTVLALLIGTYFSKSISNISSEFDTMVRDIIGIESQTFETEVDTDKVATQKWGSDEANWSTRLQDNATLWEAYVLADIKRSLLKRENIDDVLERIDKRFATMGKSLRSLVITESTAVGSLARREIFKALGITKYRYYAKIDERTCDVCGSMHGLVFPISAYEVGVTASPMHPHCRCFEIPIM